MAKQKPNAGLGRLRRFFFRGSMRLFEEPDQGWERRLEESSREWRAKDPAARPQGNYLANIFVDRHERHVQTLTDTLKRAHGLSTADRERLRQDLETSAEEIRRAGESYGASEHVVKAGLAHVKNALNLLAEQPEAIDDWLTTSYERITHDLERWGKTQAAGPSLQPQLERTLKELRALEASDNRPARARDLIRRLQVFAQNRRITLDAATPANPSSTRPGARAGLTGTSVATSVPPQVRQSHAFAHIAWKRAHPNQVRIKSARDLDDLREALDRDVFQNKANQDWLNTAQAVWGAPIRESILGTQGDDINLGRLEQLHTALGVEIRDVAAQALAARNQLEARRLRTRLVKLAEAGDYVNLLKAQIEPAKKSAYNRTVAAFRAQLGQEAKTLSAHVAQALQRAPKTEPELEALERDLRDLEGHIAKLSTKAKSLDEQGRRLNLPERDELLGEVHDRLRELEQNRKQLQSLKKVAAIETKRATQQAKERAAERERQRGETITTYEDMVEGERDARKTLRTSTDPDARANATAFLRNLPRMRSRIAKHDELESRLRSRQDLLHEYEKLASRTSGVERQTVLDDIRKTKGEIRAMERILADESPTNDYDAGGLNPRGPFGWARGIATRTKLTARKTGIAFDRSIARPVRTGLKSVRSNTGFEAATDHVADSLKVAGFSWLWRRQAKLVQRQAREAKKAQRIARSSAWELWYTFSDPVRWTLSLAMTLGPLMVPLGVGELAGWMLASVVAFIINIIYEILVEVFSLVLFGFLGFLNILGSAIEGALDKGAAYFFGALGLCETGINQPDCAYQSLHFHFGVATAKATPLIDLRFFYPTIFHNNSIASALLDFLSTVNAAWILAAALLLVLVWPFLLMEDDDWWKRLLIATGITLLALPAFFAQVHLVDSNFYKQAADLFRTGTTRILEGPGRALADAAEQAVLNTSLPTFDGGPAS